MKQIVYALLVALLLVSCGKKSEHFKINGRLLHINQGELYVYSPDGAISGMDTIKIEGGRFTYDIPSQYKATLIIVFPNFSTQAIFTEPGEKVEVKADASHLKEMQVEGTDDNELMSDLRQQIASVSPPEEVKFVKQFIKDHPESAVSVYLVEKYFILNNAPDYKEASHLINIITKAQPDNGNAERLKNQLQGLGKNVVGATMPQFTAKDIFGKNVSSASLKGKDVVVNVWASWSYESMEMQRALNEWAQKDTHVAVIGICLDASKKEARQLIERDNISFPNLCDGKMMESPLLKTFGLNTIPDNIVFKNGRIAERHLNVNTLRQRLLNLY